MNFFQNIKLQRNLLITILILIGLMYFRSCSTISSNENTYRQNIAALQDSIRTYTTKNGELVFEKMALISENGNLKSLNSDLAKEIQYLKDNPIVVVKTVIEVKEVPVKIPVYPDGEGNWNEGKSVFTQNFKWSNQQNFSEGNWRKLSGSFSIAVDTTFSLRSSKMSIDTSEFGMSLTTGLTENSDGFLEIFVKSNYPGFSVTRLDGALIEPAKSQVLKKYFPPKRWALGAYSGYGIYIDPTNMRSGAGLQFGVGLQYNIIQWNFKK
jgi:hypothetical protein